MPRKDLSLAERIALLDEIERHPPKTSYRQLAAITGTPKSTIGLLITQQDRIRKEWALCEGRHETSQKRKFSITKNIEPTPKIRKRIKPVCRICLSAQDDIVDLFSNSQRICKAIYKCTQIEIENIRGLPTGICESCKRELLVSIKFRNRCMHSESILKIKYPRLFEKDECMKNGKQTVYSSIEYLDTDQYVEIDLNTDNQDICDVENKNDRKTNMNIKSENSLANDDDYHETEENISFESKISLESIKIEKINWDYYQSSDEEEVCKEIQFQNKDDSSQLLIVKKLSPFSQCTEFKQITKWKNNAIEAYDKDEFQKEFHISKDAYKFLFEKVLKFYNRSPNGRPLTSMHKQLLSVISILTTEDSYTSISHKFELSQSTLSVTFYRTIKVICKLASEMIKWPNFEKMATIKNRFYQSYGMENIIGAIGAVYIAIKSPKEQTDIDKNKNVWMVLQGICDDQLRFINCFVSSNSFDGTSIFKNSDVFGDICCSEDTYFPDGEKILCNESYPSYEWFIPPFIDTGTLQDKEQYFNEIHSSCHEVINQSFALLFGRFKRLHNLDVKKTDMIPSTILAACIIHNVCLIFDDPEQSAYLSAGYEKVMQNQLNDGSSQHETYTNEESIEERNEMVNRLWEQYTL